MSAVRSYRVSALLKPTLRRVRPSALTDISILAAERPGEGRDRLERTDVVPPRIFRCHSDELTAFERAGMVEAVEPAREVLSGGEVENARSRRGVSRRTS